MPRRWKRFPGNSKSARSSVGLSTRIFRFTAPISMRAARSSSNPLPRSSRALSPPPSSPPSPVKPPQAWTSTLPTGGNAREPVRFFPAMNGLAATGHDLFLEIGAHPALAGAIHECLRRRGGTGTVLASQRHMEPQRAAMLRALGALFCAGRRVNWAAVFSGSANQFVRLPSYPWQRERCWQECEDVRNSKLGPPGHPLLGRRSRSAVVCWKNFLDLRLLPWLKDHVIHRRVVFPAVGYIEMALSAAREVFGDVPCVIEEAEFQRALPLPDPPERVQAQFTFSVEDAGFAIHTRVGESAQG